MAENKAGKVETNLTLNVGYFSGPASLNTGEIVGISITMVLVLMIIVVIIAVLILKVRPGGLAREKEMTGQAGPMELSYSPAPHSSQTALQAQNGSVVINGTTYTQTSPSTSGLANGYINPDVIPTMSSPQGSPDHSLEMAQNRLNSSTAGAGRYENLPLPVTSVGVEARRDVPVLRDPRRGAVNGCFSDERGGSQGQGSPLFHRDMRLYTDYHVPHLGSTSPFFHGTLPRPLGHTWVSSPLNLPDWREPELSYPPDYGLPIPRGSVRWEQIS